jgi:hypothetical protein
VGEVIQVPVLVQQGMTAATIAGKAGISTPHEQADNPGATFNVGTVVQAPWLVRSGQTWASIGYVWGLGALHLEQYNGCGLPGPLFQDTFTTPSSLGSWATTDANAVVYTGDHGGQWTEYPDGWPSTNSSNGYNPANVLSAHDGTLDFYLHNVNNNPVGANPSPLLTGTSRYITFGTFSIRMRETGGMDDFHAVPLLWPQNDANWQSAESDFPEFTMNGTDSVCAYAHYGGAGSQDSYCEPASFDPTQYHTYTQEWDASGRSYYVDGVLLGRSTHAVWSSQERWQLQMEPTGRNDGDSGHVYVSNVSVTQP